MQLDMFTIESIQIGEGFRYLLLFDFEKSTRIFKEVLEQYPDNNDALIGSVMSHYWSKIFQQCGSFDDKDDLEYFFMEIEKYNFDSIYSAVNFKNALIKKLIALMQQQHLFFIQHPTSIADLHIELKAYESATLALRDYLHQHHDDGMFLCRLANVQWLQGDKTEARRNYALALLHSPDAIEVNKISHPELVEVIKKRGAAMAAAYSWISGLLPLLNMNKEKIKIKDNAQKVYRQLFRAEKAVQPKEILKYREDLKKLNPELFEMYMKRVQKEQKTKLFNKFVTY